MDVKVVLVSRIAHPQDWREMTVESHDRLARATLAEIKRLETFVAEVKAVADSGESDIRGIGPALEKLERGGG